MFEYYIFIIFKINSLSCKLLDSAFYLCALEQNNQVYVIILKLCYQNNKSILTNHTKMTQVSDITYHDNIFIYDTDEDNYKALCAADNQNYNVKCIIIYFDVSYNYNKYNEDIIFKHFGNYQTKF